MKTRNILSIDIYVKPKPQLVNIPITITPMPKNWIRVETAKKILTSIYIRKIDIYHRINILVKFYS
jgi:hypothetical protein